MDSEQRGQTPHDNSRQKEIADRLEKLPEAKKLLFEQQIGRASEAHGSASPEFRLGLLGVYERNLLSSAEGALVNDQFRAEKLRAEGRTRTPERGAGEPEAKKHKEAPKVVNDLFRPRGYAGLKQGHADTVRQQDEQKKNDAEQALRSGNTVSPDQAANASPTVREAVGRKEFVEAARAATRDAREQGPSRPGAGRSGGRSR